MRVITAAEINGSLTFRDLVETLRSAFRADVAAPVRHQHTIARPDGADAALLLMPAWNDFAAQGTSQRGYIGVKIVSVFPSRQRDALQAFRYGHLHAHVGPGQESRWR